MAGFIAAFDPIIRLAQESPGLVWRLDTGNGHAVLPGENGTTELVNLTVWRSYPDLHAFVYSANGWPLVLVPHHETLAW
jgi:hypothetical protein